VPVDGHRVDVAEQVEHEVPAVGADVDVHPGALVGLECELRRGAVVGGDVPLVGGLLLRMERRAQEGEREHDEGAGTRHCDLFSFMIDFAALPRRSLGEGGGEAGSLSRLRHKYQHATDRYGCQAAASLRMRSGVGFFRSP
jgi:hypothetical protein